ncbi:MAG: DUF342 domain-containing protein [Alkalispirochaetaceae bacterium]
MTRMNSGNRESAFELFYRNGWVYLAVQPADRRRRRVYPEEVANRMRLLGMPRVRSSRLVEVIEEASGEPKPLVEWKEGYRLASVVTVTIGDDEMSAAVHLTAPKKGAAPPEAEEIESALAAAGVSFGVDREAVRRLIEEGRYEEEVVVARGREPVRGRSRQVEYLFELNRGKPYLEMAFGRINLKELNFIDNRKQGELIARLKPPVEPVDGKTVTGTTMPASRDDRVTTIPAGENTVLSEDGSELFAGADGNVRFRNEKVIVEPVVSVKNVNYETGNIHFDGSVVIEGSVADGFVVEAGGNIQVGQGVGRATLKAGENLLLQTGINGNNEGVLECGGNLFARYIESSTVTSRGNIFVEEAVMHSFLSARGHLILNGRRAEIIAGEAVVGGSVWCKKLGNIYDTATSVAAGVPPQLFEAYRGASLELRTTEERAGETESNLERLESAIREGHREEKFLQAREQLQQELSDLNRRALELRKRVPGLRDQLIPSKESVVVVEDTIFPGAVVTFGRYEYRPSRKGARKTVLRAGHAGIQESGYDLRDPPQIVFDELSYGEEEHG